LKVWLWLLGIIKRRFNFLQNANLEIRRYLIVGLGATVIDSGVLYLLMTYTDWSRLIAAPIGFTAGLTWSLIWSILWVFPMYKKRPWWQGLAGFGVIGIFGLLINEAIIGATPSSYLWLSKVISIVMVSIWNFIAKKVILFNN